MKWHEAIKKSKMQIARTELKPYKFCCVNGEMWGLTYCSPVRYPEELRDTIEWFPLELENTF